jgi:hypothetical protein
MVASAMAVHHNKKYGSEAYESNDMVASAMAAHHNKKYGSEAYKSNVGPPMVALLAIWLRSYGYVVPAKYGCATLNSMWDLLWMCYWQYGCVRSLGYRQKKGLHKKRTKYRL